MAALASWLLGLPRPVGVIAVTDARARQPVQACALAGLAVSQDVAIAGIDNDPMAQELSPVPLSSVIQGSAKIGESPRSCCSARRFQVFLVDALAFGGRDRGRGAVEGLLRVAGWGQGSEDDQQRRGQRALHCREA